MTAEVACGEEGHRITWRRGKLVLEDHDLLAERSLTALGSAPPLCLEILEAWRTIRGTEQLCDLLLREAPLSPQELARRRQSHERLLEDIRETPRHLTALRGHPRSGRYLQGLERQIARQLDQERRVWALTLLEALPIALRRRLALSLLVNVARHWHLESFRRERKNHVEAALAELALPLLEQSARQWRGNLKPYSIDDAELWLRAPREQRACAVWADSGGVHGALSLPLGWFTDVWARGIALLDDCFVLEAMPAPRRRDRLDVLALRWERRDREVSRGVPAPALVVQRGLGDWRLAWR